MNSEEKILLLLEKLNDKIDKIESSHSTFEQEIKSELKELRTQQKENTDFIKALVHASEFQKAEYDRLNLTLAKIEGSTKMIDHNVNAISAHMHAVEHVTQVNTYDIAKLRKANS